MDDKLANLAMSQQAQLMDMIKDHTKVLKEQSETLIRNTITVEEHGKRSTSLERDLEKVAADLSTKVADLDKKVDKMEAYIIEVRGVGKFFKLLMGVMGFVVAVGTVAALFIGKNQ